MSQQNPKRRREDSLAGSKIPLPKVSASSKPQPSAIPSGPRIVAVPATPSSSRPRMPSLTSSELRKTHEGKASGLAKPTQLPPRKQSISTAASLRTPLGNRTNVAPSESRLSLHGQQLKTPSAVSNRLSSVGRNDLAQNKFQLDEAFTEVAVTKRRRVTSAEQSLPEDVTPLGTDFNEIDELQVDFFEGSRPVAAKVQSESDENKGLTTEESEVSPVSKPDEERGLRQETESQIAVEVKPEKASDEALVGLLQEEKLALRKEFDTKIEELESEWKRKYEEVEKQKEEDAQKARNTVQEKEQELRQAIALSDELLSQTEEFEKICKTLESSKQEEIAKAIFAESEKYERVLASLRADLKNQDAIKAKVAEMDRIVKAKEEEAEMLVAQLKDQQELNEANEVHGSDSIKELEGKLQAIDSAWRKRYEELQKNSEQAKGEQIEHYKKLVAELGEQLESRKKTIQEQLVQADEIAESSHSTEILWMSKYEELHREKEELAKLLEQERLRIQQELQKGEEGFVHKVHEMEAQLQANAQELIRAKEELSSKAAIQKDEYEKMVGELRDELQKAREQETASREARFALEEELTEKAFIMEADWRKRFEDLANKKQDELSQVLSRSEQSDQNLAQLSSQLEAFQAKEAELESVLKERDQEISQLREGVQISKLELERMEAEMKMEFTQQASRLQEEFESSKHQQTEALEGSLKEKYEIAIRQKAAEVEEIVNLQKAAEKLAEERQAEIQALKESELSLANAKEEIEEELREKADLLEQEWTGKYQETLKAKQELEEALVAQKAEFEGIISGVKAEFEATKGREHSIAEEKTALLEKAELLEQEWTGKYQETLKAKQELEEALEAKKAEFEGIISGIRVELEASKARELSVISEKAALEEANQNRIDTIESSWNERFQELVESKTRELQSAVASQQAEYEKVVEELKAEVAGLKQNEQKMRESREVEVEEMNNQARGMAEAIESEWEGKYQELVEKKNVEGQSALAKQKEQHSREIEGLLYQIEALKEKETASIRERDEVVREAQKKVEAIDAEWNSRFEEILKNKEGETAGLVGQIQERHEKVVSELKDELAGYKERISHIESEKEQVEKNLMSRIEATESSWREKHAELLRENDVEQHRKENRMKQEFEEMASALREHVRTLEEEKGTVVSERESLENELRATIRSNESDWNDRYLKDREKGEEERRIALASQKEEYESLLGHLHLEVEALKDREIVLAKERSSCEMEWRRQTEFMEQSWNERFEELCMSKDSELQELIAIKKDEHAMIVEGLQAEMESLRGQDAVSAVEREQEAKAIQHRTQAAIEALEVRWTERLEEVTSQKEEEVAEVAKVFQEKAVRHHQEIEGLKAALKQADEEKSAVVRELGEKDKALKAQWEQRCIDVAYQGEMQESMASQEAENDRLTQALQEVLEAARKKETAARAEKQNTEESLALKLKELELQWHGKYEAMQEQQKEETARLQESFESAREQLLQEAQEQMERIRQESEEKVLGKERELASARLAFAQHEEAIGQRVERMKAKTAAIIQLGGGGELLSSGAASKDSEEATTTSTATDEALEEDENKRKENCLLH